MNLTADAASRLRAHLHDLQGHLAALGSGQPTALSNAEALFVVEQAQRLLLGAADHTVHGAESIPTAGDSVMEVMEAIDTEPEICDECGNEIPDVADGHLHNRHHADGCSLYHPANE